MNLYVWNSPVEVAYGDSTLLVVANTLTEARSLARKETRLMRFGSVGKDSAVCPELLKAIEKSPDSVTKLPTALLYRWSE